MVNQTEIKTTLITIQKSESIGFDMHRDSSSHFPCLKLCASHLERPE